MPYLILWLLPLMFVLALTAGLLAPQRPAAVFDVSRPALRDLFLETTEVHPSGLSPGLMEVVEARLDCYASSPIKRLQGQCQAGYLRGLVELGRRRVRSAPDLGAFAASVDLCPATFSLCMGQAADRTLRPESSSRRLCSALEARCLDLRFDRHWRGAPPPLSLLNKTNSELLQNYRPPAPPRMGPVDGQ